jgi:short-subunit dehydrogenase
VIWITGASSGIGAALAREFATDGAHLILSARRTDALEQVAASCVAAASVKVLPLDLTDGNAIRRSVREAEALHGRVDIMVHNAGVALRSLAADTTMDVDRHIMEVNYFAPVMMTKELLPSMISRGSGHFVVVSSLSALYGVPRTSAYAASKHALHGFFETLRSETFGLGIRTTIVVPGFVRTDIARHALSGDGSQHGRQLDVMERGISPESCARKIARAVRGRKRFAAVGGAEVLSIWLNRLSPSLVSWLIRQHPVARVRKMKKRLRGEDGKRI